MKRKIILIGLLLGSCILMTAQKKIELQPHKPQSVEVRLYDYNKGDFLLTLPLTFSITDDNILFVMMGNDASLADERSVWLFSKEIDLAELMKKNRNVSAAKTFKKQNKTLKRTLPYHDKIILHRTFEDGYEIIKKNAKPVFFEILASPKETLNFSLQFYVTQPKSNYAHSFIAKCKPVEFELIIKK